MFLVELIASSFLDLISKQARCVCRCKRVLVVSKQLRIISLNLNMSLVYCVVQSNFHDPQ